MLARVFTLMTACLMVVVVHAAEQADPVAEAQEAKAKVPVTLSSPRATVRTFLTAMNDVKAGKAAQMTKALSALDLSGINPLVRRERGTDLAWTLLEVMDRTRLVRVEKVSRRTKGRPWVFEHYKAGDITVAPQADGRWLFTRETLAALPKILDEVQGRKRVVGTDEDAKHLPWHLRFRKNLPGFLKRTDFLLENWQWLGLLLIVALGVVADWILSLVLRVSVRRWRKRRQEFAGVDDSVLRPLGLMAMASAWWIGLNLLGLPESALLLLLVAVKFLAALSGVWAAYRLVDLVAAVLVRHAKETDNKIDDVLVPLIPKTLKVFVTAVGIVFIADNLNINISGLLAGLGLGGLAFALAAKDMVQNLFGSVTVLLDRTFAVGDWIKVADQEGSVERIGFRSTRIRTFYNSVVTVPNSLFITATVDNMGERRYRRYSTKFGIAYETPPDRIEAYCEGVREIVRQHPYMRKDYFHVYLNDLGGSALQVMIYVFWETPEWNTELRERHRFLLDCLRLAKELGVEYAYPTQTLYVKQGEAQVAPEQWDQQTAFEQAREHARGIVERTTGLDKRPPPVTF